jgi:hypothetical protein
MNSHDNETEFARHALAIGIWENEGGAPGSDSMDHHYGRRVEADRSWSIYHVYTGLLADIRGQSMIGLSRSEATEGMRSLNLRNERRQRERNRLVTRDIKDNEIKAGRS